MHFSTTLLGLALLALSAGFSAIAAPPNEAGMKVAPGCEEPPLLPGRRAFYIDPVNGSRRNNGSAEHPWRNLQEVLNDGLIASSTYRTPYHPGDALQASSRRGVVQPGDVLYLRSGDQGEVTLRGAYNARFITVAAAPGALPVIRKLNIYSGSHWDFEGMRFESLNSTGVYAQGGTPKPDYYLVKMTAAGFQGPLDNIVIENSTFQSAEDVSKWSQQDWMEKRASGLFLSAAMAAKDAQGGRCFSFIHNVFRNIGFGIAAYNATSVLIDHNTFDHFVDDGIDYGANQMFISYNTITNSIDDGDGFHRDGMQGQPYWGEAEVLNDIVFNANTIINQTYSNLPFPGYLQGIDTFDGIWNRVKVSNNVIITNAYHGIAFYGVNEIEIINNTVMADALPGKSPTGGEPNSYAVYQQGKTWITIHGGKDGRPSTKMVVRNNIADVFSLNQLGLIADHNIVATDATKHYDAMPPGTARPLLASPDDLFVAFDPVRMNYNLHLRKHSQAIGGGTNESAPENDRDGVKRKGRVDVGAYALQAP